MFVIVMSRTVTSSKGSTKCLSVAYMSFGLAEVVGSGLVGLLFDLYGNYRLLLQIMLDLTKGLYPKWGL